MVPPDHPHTGAVRETRRKRHRCSRPGVAGNGLPSHLECFDRVGQALQLELAERGEAVEGPSSSIRPHEVGHQDLPRLRLGTQARCFDDGVTEVVVGFPCGLPGAYPYPDAENAPGARVVVIDSLLHGHRTLEGVRSRLEHHHEAVAQVLDLGAPRGGDRLAEHREVPATYFVGRIGREGGGQRRRAHQVRE